MSRYLLHYTKGRTAPRADVRRMQREPKTTVVAAEEDMVIIDGPKSSVDRLLADLSGWRVSGGSVGLPAETATSRALRAARG